MIYKGMDFEVWAALGEDQYEVERRRGAMKYMLSLIDRYKLSWNDESHSEIAMSEKPPEFCAWFTREWVSRLELHLEKTSVELRGVGGDKVFVIS